MLFRSGDVERVIQTPEHPYTRLLIDSIPWPDLSRRWGNDGIVVKESDISDKGGKGCRFASRCPYVKDQCLTALPPLYKISDQQVASCVLHEAHLVLPATQLTDVLPV